MPLIKVQTSVSILNHSTAVAFMQELSANLAMHLGKPEAYVMTIFEPEIAMTFSGSTEPACFIEIKNIGAMTPDRTNAMSKEFCDMVKQRLGVPKNRVYIEFIDVPGYMWGWNRSTFG
jgi:phenylpyruvate tautomerase PptA (4-oxalocrotonate tautomerase family)